MYLLDTNICIDFVDGRNARSRRRVVDAVGDGLGVSSITAAELLVGAKNSADPKGDREKVQRFLAIVRTHDFGLAAANAYADIVTAIGMHRRSFDRLIAAHTVSLGLILVTNNDRDFAGVPGLVVENWAA